MAKSQGTPTADEKDYLATIDQLLTTRLGDRSKRVSQNDLDKMADFDADGRTARYTKAEEYFNGDQGTMLTDRLKQYLERSQIPYCENICKVVTSALSERLSVVGVVTSEDTPEADMVPESAPMPPGPPGAPGVPPGPSPATPPKPAEPVEPMDEFGGWLWGRVWDGSQGDQRQIEVHLEAIKKGDSYLIVDYDVAKKRARLVKNSPELVRVVYSNGVKKYAIKKWYANDVSPTNPAGARVCRMNVYYPDKIEKWFRLHDDAKSTGGWVEWLDDGDEAWPTPWVDADDQPIGVPVFHFANDPRDDHYGVSEHRIVIPLQDRLNKELLDLSAVLDTMGFPQRWATGIESVESLKSTPGEVWHSPAIEATFGQFEPADPAGLLSSIESTMTRATQISRTPSYMLDLTGGTPSGEALQTSEAGLVAKIDNRKVFYGNQWGESLRMAAIVTTVYGGTDKFEQPPIKLDEIKAASINVDWKPSRNTDELQHLQTLQLMQTLGIPDEYLWSRIDGIDVAVVKKMKQANDLENAANMMNMFNRGGDTNPAQDGQGTGPPPIGLPNS